MSAAVALEGFLSDYVVGCVNKDASQLQVDLQQRVCSSVTDKFGQWAGTRTSLSTVQHITVAEIQGILNPDGWNITFREADDFSEKARRWLARPHQACVLGLSTDDRDMINCVKAIRDYIAHRSESAFGRMNHALNQIHGHRAIRHLGHDSNAPGTRRVNNIGSFLKAETAPPEERRIAGYLRCISDIAEALRP